jgi:hypothetical protein
MPFPPSQTGGKPRSIEGHSATTAWRERTGAEKEKIPEKIVEKLLDVSLLI